MKIEIKNLEKTYLYGRNVFTNFDLTIGDSEIISLYGKTGSGKTTLLKCIANVTDFKGEILYDGKKIPKHPDDVMMLFDDGALFENRTVYDNLVYSLKIRGVEKTEIAKKIILTANVFQINALLTMKVKSLSLEERKVVTLSRMFMRDSKVLLIDDVLSHLPSETRGTLWNELSKYFKDSKKTIIYSTTNRDEALSIADRVVIMTEFGIKQIASGDVIYNHPNSYWGLELVDENAFYVKGMLYDDGVDFLGKKIKFDFKNRLLSKSYIGKKVMIALHSEDMYFDDDGVECEFSFSKCIGKDYINEYTNGIKLCGKKSERKVKVLPRADKIMLFDAVTESGILKD